MNHYLRQSLESALSDSFSIFNQYASLPTLSQISRLFDDYPDDLSDIDRLNFLKYFKDVVIPHKCHVFNEGLLLMNSSDFSSEFKNNFYKRLMMHDLSKFTYTEVAGYCHKHFKTIDFNNIEFKLAWRHHKAVNDHHPEWWMSVNSRGNIEYLEMSLLAIYEMLADWLGAGHTYSESFEDWFPKNCSRFNFNPATAKCLFNIVAPMFTDYHMSIENFIELRCSGINMSKIVH